MDARTAAEILERLRADAARIAEAFGLRYRSIEPERANVKRRYGICYEDGSIRIRLAHGVTGAPLKYSSLVNTLCHELAHLRHFHHGPSFRAFYFRLLDFARREGIYRPDVSRRSDAAPTRSVARAARPGGARRPEQLPLFG